MSADHQLTAHELKAHLDEQVGFLERSADAFDAGFDGEAKRLAATLRVLLHDTAKSHSLLSLLHLKSQPFVDTAYVRSPNNLATTHSLVGIHIDEDRARYVPLLDRENGPAGQLPFDDWWAAVVFVDRDGRELTRKDLVLTAANKDGGSHVDPILSAAYAALDRGNSLGWQSQGPIGNVPLRSPERSAIRQIAHEVLKTLDPTHQRNLKPMSGIVVANLQISEVDPADAASLSAPPNPGRQPEISGGKMRFYPESGETLFRNDQSGPTIAGSDYFFEAFVDSLTQGCIRGIVGSAATNPITVPGLHQFVVRAGDDQVMGIFGSFTDAVIDRVSVHQIT